MQPFGAVEQVKETYQRFVETSFPLADDDLKAKFRQLVDEQHLLWQDPFVSLSRPFESGGTLEDLVQAGKISSESVSNTSRRLPHWKFTRLHAHQRNATHRLSSLNQLPQNTLIATGTGSGKTEAFLLSIVDHCLRHSQTPGVQAVIVYPMNALVNDQLRRLRELLQGTGVTFARYTGNTKYKDVSDDGDTVPEEIRTRKDIRKKPPQILLTNYMMLELLLLRKADRQMFKWVKPQYLVLDEIHTYTGILGAEVACLIRRFKEHSGTKPGELCCVGTSATVMSPKQDETKLASQQDLLRFASDLFGEDFKQDSILTEAYQPFSSIEVSACLESCPILTEELLKDIDIEQEEPVRRLASYFQIELPEAVQGAAFFHRLYDELAKRLLFSLFERWLEKPLSLEELARKLGERPDRAGISPHDLKLETMAVLLLGSAAYPENAPGTKIEPRYRPKVHFSMRSMTPLAMTFNLTGEAERLLSEGVTKYRPEDLSAQSDGSFPAIPGPQGNGNSNGVSAQATKSALPLAVCRSCGTPYLKGYFEYGEEQQVQAHASNGTGRRKKGLKKETSDLPDLLHLQPDQPYNRTFRELYVLLLPQQRLTAEEAADISPEDLEEGERFDPGKLYMVCPYCLVAQAAGAGATPGDMQHRDEHCPGKPQQELPTFHGFASAKSCPVCRARGKGRAARRDVITLMNGGAATSVSIITEGLLSVLGKNEKRLLIFADSRQDTAHQAGYTRDRHQTFTQRQIVYRSLHDYEHTEGLPIPLDKLHTEVYLACRRAWGSDVDAVNLLALEEPKKNDVIGFYLPDETVSGPQIKHAKDRLEWDLYLEFTDRVATRNSLEREGLVTVQYSRLDELIQEHMPQLAAYGLNEHDTVWLTNVIRAILDYMRRKKAVEYGPFTDYLSAGSDWFQRGIARPNRYNKKPIGFAAQKKTMRGAYEVFSWEAPNANIMVLVGKVLEDWPSEKKSAFVKGITELLIRKGYLRLVKIGQRSGGKAGLTTEAYQLVPKYLEVTTSGTFYRCNRCGDVRGYQLHKWGRPKDSLCPNWRCQGKTVPYAPTDNFYVQSYRNPRPEPMYVVEHSGQLEEQEREKIEEYFKAGRINVIVCTPTLELGVDIGDLPALIMRNIPPSPSSYAQRMGRAGRDRRIALSIPHAGQTPHDTYFFHHLAEMISGEIRTPFFLIDNEVVIRRHIHSLILEKLETKLPGFWRNENEKRNDYDYEYDLEEEVGEEDLVNQQGELQTGRLEMFRLELGTRSEEIAHAVAQAFAREQAELLWLNQTFVQQCCDSFVDQMEKDLQRWCERYREIYKELERLLRKVLLSKPELRRQRQLQDALDNLLRRPEYRPLSFLASAGFLPRYGFTGDLVVVRNDEERQVSQVASVGITEYALGNRVYVAGKKLLVNRVHFSRRTEDALDNAKPYKRCLTCSYMTTQLTAQECPYCHEFLVSQQYIDYEMVHGWSSETITQDDEYRQHETYDKQIYLGSLDGQEDEPTTEASTHRSHTKVLGQWKIRYSHLREVTIFNRGRIDAQTGRNERFQVCLECGAWMRPLSNNEEDEARAGQRSIGNDHLYSCPARGDLDSPAVQVVDLKVRLQGDVVEIDVPPEIAGSREYESWSATFQQALKLGLQLEYFTGPREIESFDEEFLVDGQLCKKVVFYDTMPGGTGYLRKFYDYLPQIAQRALKHLKEHGKEESCTNACYSCLKEFWNQRWHGLLDKKLVYTALAEIAADVLSKG